MLQKGDKSDGNRRLPKRILSMPSKSTNTSKQTPLSSRLLSNFAASLTNIVMHAQLPLVHSGSSTYTVSNTASERFLRPHFAVLVWVVNVIFPAVRLLLDAADDGLDFPASDDPKINTRLVWVDIALMWALYNSREQTGLNTHRGVLAETHQRNKKVIRLGLGAALETRS